MNEILGVHGLPMLGDGLPQPKQTLKKFVPTKEEIAMGNEACDYHGDVGAGCSFWRMLMPQIMINYSKAGHIMSLTKLIPDPNFYENVKTVRLQRQASTDHLRFMRHLRDIADKKSIKMIYEIDDVILKEDIPDFNIAKAAYTGDGIYEATMEMMTLCDVMSVSCDYLKQYLSDKTNHGDIRVMPNKSLRMWFDGFYDSGKIMKKYHDNSKKPRILYAGSGNHFNLARKKGVEDDFSHVVDQIAKTVNKFQWVFMGGYPYELKEYIDNGKIELVPWVDIHNYPSYINSININAVIAPLYDCHFNRAKSNIKYLEAAYLGIPGVFQDIVTYKDAPLRFNTGDEMIDQLQKLLTNSQYYAKMSKLARKYADTMWLDDAISDYTHLYFGE